MPIIYGGSSAGLFGGNTAVVSGGTFTNVTINNATIGSGAIGVASAIGTSGISIGIAPTGTMANNGAVTFGTALDRTYSEGLWLFYAAGAVAAGVPAAASFLWTVMSSATVGTVFNSTYTTGVPAVGTQTAFATTGPGAFTGDTTERFVTIPVAANVLGLMGKLDIDVSMRNNNSAGTKTVKVHWSGSGGASLTPNVTNTTGIAASFFGSIANMLTNAQTIVGRVVVAANTWTVATNNAAIDTTAATSVVFGLQLNTATDWMMLSHLDVTLKRSS